jgi:hypothetical protein
MGALGSRRTLVSKCGYLPSELSGPLNGIVWRLHWYKTAEYSWGRSAT